MTVTISGNGTITGVTVAPGIISSGTVAYFAASTAPTGWLAADGSAISRTTYSSLFSAIGTTFGSGDGSTTFNLPNLGGQFVRSWISGQSVDSGRAFGSTQSHAFASHTHSMGNTLASAGGGAGIAAGNGSAIQGQTTVATGGTETRPVNVALLGCIKT